MNRRHFALLWLGAFAFFLSFLLLLGALPIFARRLGATDAAVGAIMAAFAVTSLLLRPVAGWGVDRYGRRPFMLVGALVFAVASVAYGAAAGAAGLVVVRLVHGCGMGLYPTAAGAMVADLAPPHRRGEILGIYGAAGSVALAIGPVTGVAIVERAGFGALFWTAGAVAAVSVAVTAALGETLARPRPVPFTLAGTLSRAALFPGLLAFFLLFTYGAQITFLPLHADSMGANPGVFFLVFALTTTMARGPAGRLSDRAGRAPVAAAGLVLAAAALVVLACSKGPGGIAAAGAVYGFAYGVAQPALIAWSVDAVPEGERGRAIGTYHMAFELGIVAGAAASGLAVEQWGFAPTFLTTAGVAAAGSALALAGRHRRRSRRPCE
ncbi:MAG TPA: MFS transporter [Methylomirabilota bacterium]|nr:MFS transporter [Methylomirabilota bacterium]